MFTRAVVIIGICIIGMVLIELFVPNKSNPYSDYDDAVTKAVYNARVKEICDKAGLITRTAGDGIVGCYDYTYAPSK